MGLKPQLCSRFHHAVELIGGRWTGAVIQLLLNGRMRFAELRDAIPDISDRMLSERLRELEAEEIVERIVVPETPVRVEYELTDKGRAQSAALARFARGQGVRRLLVSPLRRAVETAEVVAKQAGVAIEREAGMPRPSTSG